MIENIMPFNPEPEVSAARDYGKKFNKDLVIIISVNTEAWDMKFASYGEDKKKCKSAQHLANIAYDAIWNEIKKNGL